MSEEGRKLSQEEKAAMFGQMTGNKPQEQPPQEVVDEKREEVKEDVVEEAQEQAVEQAAKETEEVLEQPEFDIASLNKIIGREFESIDALKSLFEKADDYDKTKSSYDELSQKLSEYQSLAEGLDPLSYFANEDEYVRQQFLKNNSENLSSDAIKALSVLSPSKIKEMDTVDVLKIDLMVNDGMSGEEAEAYLQKKYDVDDFSSEDLDLGVKATIKKDVNDAKKSLSKLYHGIEIPSKVDYEAARGQLKEIWNQPVKDIVSGIDKIEIEEGLDFVVTPEMKQGLEDIAINNLLKGQVKPSEEATMKLVGELKDRILLNNLDKVAKSMRADLTEKIKAEIRAEIHNDRPLKEEQKPRQSSADNESKMHKFLH